MWLVVHPRDAVEFAQAVSAAGRTSEAAHSQRSRLRRSRSGLTVSAFAVAEIPATISPVLPLLGGNVARRPFIFPRWSGVCTCGERMPIVGLRDVVIGWRSNMPAETHGCAVPHAFDASTANSLLESAGVSIGPRPNCRLPCPQSKMTHSQGNEGALRGKRGLDD
jgi:hypothetical protein